MEDHQIVEAALGHLERARRRAPAIDLRIAFVHGERVVVPARVLQPAPEIVGRGDGALGIGGRADIGQCRAAQRLGRNQLRLRQESVLPIGGQKDGFGPRDGGGTSVDVIKGIGHGHGGAGALALPLRHDGQRQVEQCFLAAGAGQDLMIAVDEPRGKPKSRSQPIHRRCPKIRRAEGLGIARPLGLVLLQHLGEEGGGCRLRLAHRQGKDRPARPHVLESMLKFHPFTLLNALLENGRPGGPVLALSVGEPQAAPPAFLAEVLEKDKAEWSRYPQTLGTPDFRASAVDWLTARFRLPAGLVDRDHEVLPCAGSKEALFHLALAVVPEWQGKGPRPAVAMPNPFYHVYAGAAAVAGAEPIFLPANRENGFLPEPDLIPPEALSRTALAYVCSPSNPQGAIASPDYLGRWLKHARRHNYTLAVDECYAEIYRGSPPARALEVAHGSLDTLVVFHSLSKRSSAPGLRSGFIA